MPFQSEKQRRYLWANEPEIARDWADTYGSRIESNTGGISRLGFANGPNYQVAEEDEDENYLEKFMRFMQGNAGNLSKADVTANTNFLGNMKFSPNNPYRMTSGLFKGKNAPGSSALGSKNPQEMAQKWVDKFGGVDHQTTPMKEKKANIRMEAGLSPIENAPHHSYSGGGISRLGYAQGNPHQDQNQGLGMSPGAAQARGLGALHHGSTTSGNLHAGNVGGGNVGGNNQGQGPTLDISDVVETFDKGKNALSLIKLFKDQGPMGLLPWGMQKGKQWLDKKYNINQDDTWGQSSLDDETDEVEGQLAFNPGSILDSQIKNAWAAYNELGLGQDSLEKLMRKDIKNKEKKGTPLSLPASAYTLIS
jgi:hypothetical protein